EHHDRGRRARALSGQRAHAHDRSDSRAWGHTLLEHDRGVRVLALEDPDQLARGHRVHTWGFLLLEPGGLRAPSLSMHRMTALKGNSTRARVDTRVFLRAVAAALLAARWPAGGRR